MTDDADRVAAYDATTAFLEERGDAEEALEAALAVDAAGDPWTFEEIAVDSGVFGELVSRGVVEKRGDGYRVADREGVQAALSGEDAPVEGAAGGSEGGEWGFSLEPQVVAAVTGALAVLVAMRAFTFPWVFREGRVVSPENDPYHYRYWMETLLAESDGVTDFGVVTEMQSGAAGTRPLTHATNWFFAALLGGDQWAADMVAAWLPVFATVLLGIVLYWLAVVVTDDVRVGVAAILLLALTPVHAVYTGLGFLEHRLHQYLWLGVTLLSLAWLAVDLQTRRELESSVQAAVHSHLRCPWTWVATGAMGLALAFSAHAWGGSVLMFVPVAAYVGLKVAVDVRAGLSPGRSNLPISCGLGIGGAISAVLHFSWGWHEPFVALVPLLVFGGVVGVSLLGELWRRLELPVGGLIALEGVLAVLGLIAFRVVRPAEWGRLLERMDDLLLRERYTEVASLFTMDLGIILGPLAQIGVGFYVAMVVLGWACWVSYRRYEPAWLLLSVYSLFWLVMATVQVRFAAQLAISISVLGGLGLVYLLSWVELARVPVPFREGEPGRVAADGGEQGPGLEFPTDVRTAGYLVAIVLLVCGLSLVFVPSLVAQTTHGNAELEAALVIDEHAEEVDREYPANFVLSQWDENRFFNYFVNGETQGYSYADRHFDEFRIDGDPDDWYDEFEDDVGYLALTEWDGPEGSAHAQLHDDLGAGGNESEALAHYQVLFVEEEVTAFAVVPGATITGDGEPGETLEVETDVSVSGAEFAYRTETTVDESGTFNATVPYDGGYEIGGESVEVTSEDVLEGESVVLE